MLCIPRRLLLFLKVTNTPSVLCDIEAIAALPTLETMSSCVAPDVDHVFERSGAGSGIGVFDSSSLWLKRPHFSASSSFRFKYFRTGTRFRPGSSWDPLNNFDFIFLGNFAAKMPLNVQLNVYSTSIAQRFSTPQHRWQMQVLKIVHCWGRTDKFYILRYDMNRIVS